MHSSAALGFNTYSVEDKALHTSFPLWNLREHDLIPSYPLPPRSEVPALVDECVNRGPRDDPGPLSQKLERDIRQWYRRMFHAVKGSERTVTGALRGNLPLMEEHLRSVPSPQKERVLMRIKQGVQLPWLNGRPPSHPIRVFANNPELRHEADKVWSTLSEWLLEGAVRPWNVAKRGLPMGMSPIKWVLKSGSDKVRIVIVLCAINKMFEPDSGKCKLQTLTSERYVCEPFDWMLTTDKHNSFFHYEVCNRDHTWTGFSLHPNELPDGVADLILREYGSDCFHEPSGRFIFFFAGMPQGATMSTAYYDDLSSAILQGFRTFRHGSQVPRCRHYIDDYWHLFRSLLLKSGCRDLCVGFWDALIFQYHFLVRMTRLGFTMNIMKTTCVPSLHAVHLGFICSSPDLFFRETCKGANKLAAARSALREAVRADAKSVPCRVLAKFVGLLWSRKLLMHRAVPVMTRGMVNALAVQLRLALQPWFTSAKRRMRFMATILKRQWKGSFAWDEDAEEELTFWESVCFLQQQAPMRFDSADDAIRTHVLRPHLSSLRDDVHVYASDASDTATGAAEFVISKNSRFVAKRTTTIPLSADESERYSTLWELLGCYRLDLAIIPDHIIKVILLCDSFSTVCIIKRSSSIPELARISRKFFLKCLAVGRIVIPMWLPRDHALIVPVDRLSRLKDLHPFCVPAAVFWRANTIAKSLWGRGFQVDRAASHINVMPVDLKTRLPFNSRDFAPHTSGVNMFNQSWSGYVNWCNPPFFLIGRILRLLQRQYARAALVIPHISSHWWDKFLIPSAPFVKHVWTSGSISARNAMRWPDGSRLATTLPYDIYFLDFSEPGKSAIKADISAERLPVAIVNPTLPLVSQLTYLSLSQK